MTHKPPAMQVGDRAKISVEAGLLRRVVALIRALDDSENECSWIYRAFFRVEDRCRAALAAAAPPERRPSKRGAR